MHISLLGGLIVNCALSAINSSFSQRDIDKPFLAAQLFVEHDETSNAEGSLRWNERERNEGNEKEIERERNEMRKWKEMRKSWNEKKIKWENEMKRDEVEQKIELKRNWKKPNCLQIS